jgi:hypothetical protein
MMNETLAGPDVIRAVIVSLSSLLLGGVLAVAVELWRLRLVMSIRHVPYWAVILFIGGYVALIAIIAVDRWTRIGQEHLVPGTYMAVAALAVNLVSLAVIMRYIRFPIKNNG